MKTKKLSGPVFLITNSLEIFFKRENLVYFVKIYCVLVPFSLFEIYQNYFINSHSDILNSINPSLLISKYTWFFTATIGMNLLSLVATLFVGICGIKAVAIVLGKDSKSIKEVFKFGWNNLWKFFLLSILLLLVTFGGMILLIIPGVIFSVWFVLSKFAFVDQNLGVFDSMKKSKELVKGRFWAVFGRIIIFGVFAVLVGIILSYVPYLGPIVSALLGGLFIFPYFLLYKELAGKN